MQTGRLALALLILQLAGTAGGQQIADPSTKPGAQPERYEPAQAQKSKPGRVSPPNAPSNLTAVSVTGRKVDLTWTDNADDEDEYVVDRRLESVGSYTTIATLGANVTSYTDDTVNKGISYQYIVMACRFDLCSTPSNELTVHIPPLSFFIGD